MENHCPWGPWRGPVLGFPQGPMPAWQAPTGKWHNGPASPAGSGFLIPLFLAGPHTPRPLHAQVPGSL